ncbi:DUF814 domain-containing protein [Candidatus Woesearchaeota archaeon]|nr:DUF814 domain-containing protein [Candidatus Woesearchaeota archaeon]
MTRVTIDINKSIEENAGLYYENAKKLKKKIQGVEKTIENFKKDLAKVERRKAFEENPTIKKTAATQSKKEWYEKFRWFISSEGFLVIGGRDATSNEIVIKKHTDKDDLVFHTDMVGSPFFVIKAKVNVPTPPPPPAAIGDVTLREVADATVTFSRAWKLGMQNTATFCCKPEQLTKEAPSGEFVPRGGFITKGKLNYVENKISLAVGNFNGKIMAGPLNAIKKHCEKYAEIEQGEEKTSKIAKQIQYKIGGELDDIVRALPAGGCEVKG